ncbi:hypothetical protein IV03_08505 [Pseudomonas congelans]|nr:hypothetical protein IV03_08505 [Pseudomonas congelans]
MYDHGHTGVFLHEAKICLNKALNSDAFWESSVDPAAEDYFRRYEQHVEALLDEWDYDESQDLNQWSLGKTKSERVYRQWALDKKLFLSPINDCIFLSAAAQDIIHLPNHSYDIREHARFPNYFNILKQEYVTARFLYFEASSKSNKHFSDREVLLFNGLDGVYFGYRNEQLKMAYRQAYSIFDKVAMFIKDYFRLDLTPTQVSFKKIWGTKKDAFALNPFFENSNNLPLRGLYFIFKDLFDEDFIESSLPETQELSETRNFVEHRFLSIQDISFSADETQIHKYIGRGNFILKTERILTMAREALIYLSLSMHHEELERNALHEKTNTFDIQSDIIKWHDRP